jgi:O-antigen/teichoic acid export membrane protein
MRISTRLIMNAFWTYARLGATFLIGIFFTAYVVHTIGIAGLGMIGLVSATFGLTAGLQVAIRQSLVRELAAAIATEDNAAIGKSLTASMVLCLPTAGIGMAFCLLLAGLAMIGVFRTPADEPSMNTTLAIMLVAEGVHIAVRLIAAPYLQSIFAAQRIGIDNFLQVVNRTTYALSAVIVFGIICRDQSLSANLIGFAISRASLQLLDVVVGLVIAKRCVKGLKVELSRIDWTEFRSVLGTVWHTGQVTLLMNLFDQVLAILINLFFGVTYNGVWQIVVQVGGQARQIAEGLMQGIEPLVTNLQHKGQSAAISNLMIRTVRYQLIVSLPMAATYLIFLTPVLNLWVGSRLARDTKLAAAGLTAEDAIAITALLSGVQLVATVLRVSTRGVERVLYGAGEVRSYSWFAKYAFVMLIGLSSLAFWLLGSPVWGPVTNTLIYGIFYVIIIPRAAQRVWGLPLRTVLTQSVPRPIIATAILVAGLLLVRQRVDAIGVIGLLLLLMGVGFSYGFLTLVISLLPDERARLMGLTVGRVRAKFSR